MHNKESSSTNVYGMFVTHTRNTGDDCAPPTRHLRRHARGGDEEDGEDARDHIVLARRVLLGVFVLLWVRECLPCVSVCRQFSCAVCVMLVCVVCVRVQCVVCCMCVCIVCRAPCVVCRVFLCRVRAVVSCVFWPTVLCGPIVA
jgi:hypothetical protein